MQFQIAVHTDVGIRKSTNQDSLAVREAETPAGQVLMAVLCDGMGGLAKGELASATIIRAFTAWFEEEFPLLLSRADRWEEIRYQWDRKVKELNQTILEYGWGHNIQLGSTLTVLLFLENGEYLISHVGDCRAYQMEKGTLVQLTTDQTLVASEVRLGRLTPEQAAVDPRRNILLQCVGASKVVEPEYISGKGQQGQRYLLCSDGFRHEITPEEILTWCSAENSPGEESMQKGLAYLTELCKSRGETDNISAILITLG